MFSNRHRIDREKRTVEAMIHVYCQGKHKTRAGFCDKCNDLLNYATSRLAKCPFQAAKTTCANCKVHCYKPSMREKIKTVMRYAGPRMFYRHPVLAAFHFIDGFRKGPSSDNLKTK